MPFALVDQSQVPASEPTDIAGGRPATWVNVSTYPLFSSTGPSPRDANESGQLGDCWFIAGIAEIAQITPSYFPTIIHQNLDGTYTVHINDLHLISHDVVVDGWLPAFDNTHLLNAGLGQENCVWAAILEKAATVLYSPANAPTYHSINGASANLAFGILGIDVSVDNQYLKPIPGDNPSNYGPTTHVVHSGAELYDAVTSLVAGHRAAVLTSGSDTVTAPLVNDHAYSIVGTSTDVAGNKFIELRNPWGIIDGLAHDGYLSLSADVVYAQFHYMDSFSV